jgi:hypothetical protein
MRTEYDDVIRAWLDGAEVEERHESENKWMPFEGIWVVDSESGWQYRIAKPVQEPKYLYVYLVEDVVKFSQQKDGAVPPVYSRTTTDVIQTSKYLGKIRLEE